MVFKVEAKTAIDESRSWVRIARNRLLALADASADPQAGWSWTTACSPIRISLPCPNPRPSTEAPAPVACSIMSAFAPSIHAARR
jgi:hypothetical protein